MMHTVRDAFTRHPEAVGENYAAHFGVAMRYSMRLFGAAFAALVHAFLPFFFEKTASTAIKAMHAEMMNRGSHAPAARPQPAE